MSEAETNIILETLKKSFVFANAQEASLGALSKHAAVKHLEKGDIIFAENEASTYLYVLVSGRITFFMHDEHEKRYTLGLIADFSIFGDMEIFAQGERVSHAEVLEDAVVIAIPSEQFKSVVRGDAEISYRIVQFYAALLQRLTRFSLFRDVEKQFAYILVDLCKRYGKPVRIGLDLSKSRDGIEIQLAMNQEFLGSLIGVPRQRINTILKTWEKKQWVQVEYNKVFILDEPALKAFSIL